MKNAPEIAADDPRVSPLASGKDLEPWAFPELWTLSGGFFYSYVPVPREPMVPPEIVYVPIRRRREALATWGQVAQWEMAWEARHLRHRMFRIRELPKTLRWIPKYSDCDFRLVPFESNCRYPAYTPLYHLLPLRVLQQFGLPSLKRGIWPGGYDWGVSRALPTDWEARLSQAVAYHLWPLLCPNSAPSMFSMRDPLRLLAHHLDFWLPYLDVVAQQRRSLEERCGFDRDDPGQPARLAKARRRLVRECDVERPLMGGYVWTGEEEAWEATKQLVEAADAHGSLRGIIDAVQSNRVADDFSSRWSWAKEDFERKLYRKRAKTKVTFVELNDTAPVHAPDTEAHENLLWQDFLAILDQRERRVVVCLRSGFTKAVDIAERLGYANHSPVSKALARIRQKAQLLLDK